MVALRDRQDRQGKRGGHQGPCCSIAAVKIVDAPGFVFYIKHIKISIIKAAFLCDSCWRWLTHPPISSALSNNGSRVEVQVLQVEVAFDIVREVFVFLSTTIMKG